MCWEVDTASETCMSCRETLYVWLYLQIGVCIKWKKKMLYKKCLYMYSVYTCTSPIEIDLEIFSTVILSLPLIQEGQLLVSGERMCTILVNCLED